MIVAGSASVPLAREAALLKKEALVEVQTKRFPDGELYVRVPESEGGKATVIQSTNQPDGNLLELFLTVDALRNQGVRDIEVIMPYYGYSRQDKIFLPGEALTARLIAQTLKGLGAAGIKTVDCHFFRERGTFEEWGIPIINTTASGIIAEHVKQNFPPSDFLVVSPDETASENALNAAKILGCGVACFDKKRNRITGEITTIGQKAVCGTALMLDDIIAGGGTMMKAAALVDAGKKIFACTHGIFAGDSLQKLMQMGDVLSTNTIQSAASVISVAKLLV